MTNYINEDGTYVSLNETFNPNEYIYYDGNYYHIEHPDVFRCYDCSRFIHKNLLAKVASTKSLCLKCAIARGNNDYVYCNNCKHVHKKNGVCGGLNGISSIKETAISFGQSINVNTESHDFNTKGCCVLGNIVTKIGQYQSEKYLPKDIKYILEEFYYGHYRFNYYYYWGDYKIEGDINYVNMQKFRDILNKHQNIVSSIYNENQGYKLSPYRNYVLQGITQDGLLQWAKYDLMGKLKCWTEKPNTFLQNIGKEIDNEDNGLTLHYVLSSDLQHKLLAFQMNSKFGSCQKKENYNSYAAGAYDAVTNGCNCPILIYRQGSKDPLGRITCRIMYDDKGKEYLLLERLYHDGTLGDNSVRGKIYANIAHDLKCKGYNVIASNYSAHDSSTYSYLAKFGLSSNTKVKDLCQPLRQLVNGYGYYCDSGTEVYHKDIDGLDWATDYLDEAYLI